METSIDNKETHVKRVRVYEKIISDENLKEAIETVIRSHKWIHYPDRRNSTTERMEKELPERIKELRRIIEEGFIPSPATAKRRWDANAGKWRDICEPRLWPDQCVHHALIQALEPVLMRGMDHWCCGSIKGRGAHYGVKAIKKWRKRGRENWCLELDIRHFYESLDPKKVMERMRTLVKDRKTLDLVERVMKDGIQIGAYYSQWLANTFLQPLDQLIRAEADKYIRYMDNFTIMTRRKKQADKIMKLVEAWLKAHGLELKGNKQKFRMSKRLPNALGYRFGKDYTLLRKRSLLRLKRQLRRYYRLRERGNVVPVKFAQGLLSRLGMLRHCNSVKLYARLVHRKTQKQLKDIIREEAKKWSTALVVSTSAA